MTKKEVQQRVLKNGKPLDLDKFKWDKKTNAFSSKEGWLTLDFGDCAYCIFKTGTYCNFDTGSYCIFFTGSDCNFDTGTFCNFITGSDCTFKTGSRCTFKTGKDCVIIRRDIFEIIQPKKNEKIRLNGCGIKGFEIIK